MKPATSKELVTRRQARELVPLGTRLVSPGGWDTAGVMRHILEDHRAPEWCNASCLASKFYGRNSQANRERVLQRRLGVFNRLLERNVFLVTRFARQRSGPAIEWHVFDHTRDEDCTLAAIQVDRMRRTNELKADKLALVSKLLGYPGE